MVASLKIEHLFQIIDIAMKKLQLTLSFILFPLARTCSPCQSII